MDKKFADAGVVRFGVFEFDLAAGELRKSGLKVKLHEQPMRVLAVLLERPGEIVTREELRQRLWSEHTYVDFDHGLNTTVNRLRTALGDSTVSARFIETIPRRGYRFIAPIRTGNGVGGPRESALATGRMRWRLWPLMAAGAVLAVGAGLVAWRMPSRLTPESPQTFHGQLLLTRLTSDSGITYQPALSPDGKFVAYASDRGGKQNLDIWIQQAPYGRPIQLTHDEADDWEPAFSPDGTKIAFASARDGGGIFVMPALGGEERRIASGGRRPQFSPDGNWIAYVWPAGEAYVVPVAGGQARRFLGENARIRSLVWTPDGKGLLFYGSRHGRWGWHVASVSGERMVVTGASAVFRKFKLEPIDNPGEFIAPLAWIPGTDQVVFSARSGDSVNLWKIPISLKTWLAAGEPQRITAGTGVEFHASVSHTGRLAFSSLSRNLDIWSLPIGGRPGRTGKIEQVTEDSADEFSPSLSANGKMLVFESNKSGGRTVWLKELETGHVKPLTETPSVENMPKVSPDGSKVAYRLAPRVYWMDSSEKIPGTYVTSLSGGESEEVCRRCAPPYCWSPDSASLLYSGFYGPPYYIGLSALNTRKQSVFLYHPELWLWEPDFSPDGRWVLFGAVIRPGPKQHSQIFLVPFDGDAHREDDRATRSGDGPPFNVAGARFPASKAAGKRIRYSGYIRTDGITEGYAGLWWRADGKQGSVLKLDNMRDRGPKGTQPWRRYEIEMKMPAEAAGISFGVLHAGKGEAWFDSLELEIEGRSYPVRELFDIESGNVHGGGPDYRFELDEQIAHSGGRSLRSTWVGQRVTPPDSEWIAWGEGFMPRWSADGKSVYFLSKRDGFTCIWAQRVDMHTKRPVGAPSAVYHSHSSKRSLKNVVPSQYIGLSVARDKIVFVQAELAANVWMVDLGDPAVQGKRP